jgi:ribosomal protein S9
VHNEAIYHDAADDVRASYEHHPVEDIEPEEDIDLESLSPVERERLLRLCGQAFEKVLRWVVEEVPLTGYRPPNTVESVLTGTIKAKTVTLRALAVAYILRPGIFTHGGKISAAYIARRLGIAKQRFNWYISKFRQEFKFQSQVMRSAEARENMREAMRKSHARRQLEKAAAGCDDAVKLIQEEQP